jgi:hypothetical protein
MYWVDIQIENATSDVVTVTIPSGTVFEPAGELGIAQSLVSTEDVTIEVPSGKHTVRLPALCLNQNLPAPRNLRGAMTALRMREVPGDQRILWARVNGT